MGKRETGDKNFEVMVTIRPSTYKYKIYLTRSKIDF